MVKKRTCGKMTVPVVQATINAVLLTTLSNILAQFIQAYRRDVYFPDSHFAEAPNNSLLKHPWFKTSMRS